MTFTKGQVRTLPVHHGDGIVTVGDVSIFVGAQTEVAALAKLLAAAPALLIACKELVEGGECWCERRDSICAVCLGRNAIAMAE